MDEVGVYCSWEMPGPGWSTLHRHLHYVPGERSFSVTRVLVVCSACQVLVFVNRRLSAGLPAGESLGAIGLSVIPGWTPSCTVSHSSVPPWYFLSPLVHELIHRLRPVSPPHSPSSILLPSLPFRFFFVPHTSYCPFTLVLSLHPF